MLAHPTLDQLHALGLHGLAKGFKDLERNAEARGLDHAEWLGLLLEYELTLRRQKQFETRARVAKLRHPASVEDVNYQSPRGLDRALFLKLAACDWIAERRNLLITGASGLGKSWLACALGHRRAEKTSPSSILACPGSSPTSPSPTATPAMPGSCARWPA
jgi:DNA replication protein DnaC